MLMIMISRFSICRRRYSRPHREELRFVTRRLPRWRERATSRVSRASIAAKPVWLHEVLLHNLMLTFRAEHQANPAAIFSTSCWFQFRSLSCPFTSHQVCLLIVTASCQFTVWQFYVYKCLCLPVHFHDQRRSSLSSKCEYLFDRACLNDSSQR